MRRIALMVVGFALVVGLVSCGGEKPTEPVAETPAAPEMVAPAQPVVVEEPEQAPDIAGTLANPVASAADSDEVFAVTGVRVVLRADESLGFELGSVSWSTIGQQVAQAVFWAKDMNGIMPMGEATLTVRAMATDKPEDISGVYEHYTDEITETYTTSAGTPVAAQIRSTEGIGAVATWYNPDTHTSWSASFTDFATDYMTTAAVMKYLVEDVINLN